METKQETQEVSAILASLPADQKAKIEAAMKKVAAKRTPEAEIKTGKNGDLVVDGSLKYNDAAKKQEVSIRCSIDGCKETRTVFTSDLHQVRTCLTHRKEQRKVARQNRATEQKRLIEAGKAAQIKA